MNSRNPVILCVDDDEVILKLLEEILVLSGYKAVGAASGKDALLKIKSQTIDLVLLSKMGSCNITFSLFLCRRGTGRTMES